MSYQHDAECMELAETMSRMRLHKLLQTFVWQIFRANGVEHARATLKGWTR